MATTPRPAGLCGPLRSLGLLASLFIAVPLSMASYRTATLVVPPGSRGDFHDVGLEDSGTFGHEPPKQCGVEAFVEPEDSLTLLPRTSDLKKVIDTALEIRKAQKKSGRKGGASIGWTKSAASLDFDSGGVHCDKKQIVKLIMNQIEAYEARKHPTATLHELKRAAYEIMVNSVVDYQSRSWIGQRRVCSSRLARRLFRRSTCQRRGAFNGYLKKLPMCRAHRLEACEKFDAADAQVQERFPDVAEMDGT